jgi:hypothetical protein
MSRWPFARDLAAVRRRRASLEPWIGRRMLTLEPKGGATGPAHVSIPV